METKTALEKFVNYMVKEKGRNALTVRNYKSYVERFIRETGVEKVEDITIEAVENFKQKLLEQKLSKKTVNYYLIGMRIFLRYLSRQDILSLNSDKIETFEKTPDKKMELVSKEELKTFLTTKVSPVSDLLVNILFSTGLRIFELHSLDAADFARNKCSFTVVGKGGKLRIAFLAPEVCKALSSFLGERVTGGIFLNEATGEKLTVRTLQRIVEERADYVKLSHKITPHTLRHHFATSLLKNGMDIRSVQELLGHESIVTTQKYTHITNVELEKGVAKFREKLPRAKK